MPDIRKETAKEMVAKFQEIGLQAPDSLIELSKDEPVVGKSVQKTLKEIVKEKGGGVDVTDEGQVRLSFSLGFSNKGKRKKEDYRPDADELPKINAWSSIDLAKDDVYSLTFLAADQNADRVYDHIEKRALKDMSEMYAGKPILENHWWMNEYRRGLVYDAVTRGGDLMVKAFFRDKPSMADFMDNVFSGIYSHVSVSFGCDMADVVCDSCRKEYYGGQCPHYRGSVDEAGNIVTTTIKRIRDVYELSFVAVPAIPRAGVASRGGDIAEASENFKKSIIDIVSIQRPDLIDNPKAMLKSLQEVMNLFGLKDAGLEELESENEAENKSQPDLTSVDTIHGDKQGDLIVSDVQTKQADPKLEPKQADPAVETKQAEETPPVTPPIEVKAPEAKAPEVKAPETPAVDPVAKSVDETITLLAEGQKQLTESLKGLAETVLQIGKALETQAETVTKAINLSVEQQAAKSTTTTQQVPKKMSIFERIASQCGEEG